MAFQEKILCNDLAIRDAVAHDIGTDPLTTFPMSLFGFNAVQFMIENTLDQAILVQFKAGIGRVGKTLAETVVIRPVNYGPVIVVLASDSVMKSAEGDTMALMTYPVITAMAVPTVGVVRITAVATGVQVGM